MYLHIHRESATLKVYALKSGPFHSSDNNENTPLYGATRAMILAGQKDAKKRVFLFISIFFVTGIISQSLYMQLCDLFHVLCYHTASSLGIKSIVFLMKNHNHHINYHEVEKEMFISFIFEVLM